MKLSATAKWIGLALLGLAIAAVVAIAASNLVSRQIGITSESVSAGDSLAPAVESAARRPNGSGGAAQKGSPPATGATTEPKGSGSAVEGGGVGEENTGSVETSDEREDRLKDDEDAREDLEDQAADEAEDRLKTEEDALKDLEDNSGKGSDD